MLELVIEFLNELEKDLEDGEVAIRKCSLEDMDFPEKEQYYKQHRANLQKVKRCGIESKIKALNLKLGNSLRELNLMRLKEIGFPHIMNEDGTITYYVIVDTQIEKIIYKKKNYYIPKNKRNIWVFGTVNITLDFNRNHIITYDGNLKGYIHQEPGGSCLCIGNLSLNLDSRNKPIEIWLKELQKQFSIANLDSTFYTKNSKLYRLLRTTIGTKRLSGKKKIMLDDMREREERDRIEREREEQDRIERERREREEREFGEIIEAGMKGLEKLTYEVTIEVIEEIEETEERMFGDVLEHKHSGCEYWHPASRVHARVIMRNDNGIRNDNGVI